MINNLEWLDYLNWQVFIFLQQEEKNGIGPSYWRILRRIFIRKSSNMPAILVQMTRNPLSSVTFIAVTIIPLFSDIFKRNQKLQHISKILVHLGFRMGDGDFD